MFDKNYHCYSEQFGECLLSIKSYGTDMFYKIVKKGLTLFETSTNLTTPIYDQIKMIEENGKIVMSSFTPMKIGNKFYKTIIFTKMGII